MSFEIPPHAEGPPNQRALGAPSVVATRPDPHVVLLEATAMGYQEVFFIVATSEMLTVVAYEPSDDTLDAPRIHHVPKPYGWSNDVPDDELLVQLWQAIGHQR